MTVSSTHNNSPALSLSTWAYRVCCNSIISVASKTFNTIALPLNSCVNQVRKIHTCDFLFVTSLKLVNGAYILLFKAPLIPSSSLKTLVEKNREKEIIQLRNELSQKPIYIEFSKTIAHYINECIPRAIVEQFISLPPMAEKWVLFKSGYVFRYVNYQIDKRYHYRDVCLSHKIGKLIQAKYLGIGLRLAHMLAHEEQTKPILNFEYLFLNLFSKIKKNQSHLQTAKTIVQSLAHSFSQQKDIEEFMSKFQFSSNEEAFIARLEWHKTHGYLPKGLPDPHAVRLTPQNLQEKLDEAFNQYLAEIIEKFLTAKCPNQLKTGVAGLFYFLEGKDILIKLLTYLIAEFGFKQLVDPHAFALALLIGNGVETMDYELDGFGREKKSLVLRIGQEIMSKATYEKASSSSLITIFENSGLKSSPGSFEAFLQKKAAKEQLKERISSIFHQMIKPENYQHPDIFLKNMRKKVEQVPVVNTAMLGLHLLINGSFFSFNYLFKNKAETCSFSSYMFRHLAGKNLTNYFAERMVELVYHPSWRITLLQIIESIFSDQGQNPEGQEKDINHLLLKKNLHKITEFVFEHFTKNSSVPLKDNLGPLLEHFNGDTILKLFLNLLKPSETPLIDKILKSILPTVEELLFYTRVIDSFRKESVSFDGDAKFWEFFLRETLNQLVAIEIRKKSINSDPIPLAEMAAIRQEIVKKLLSLKQQELRSLLSKLPQSNPTLDSQTWNIIGHRDSCETESLKIEDSKLVQPLDEQQAVKFKEQSIHPSSRSSSTSTHKEILKDLDSEFEELLDEVEDNFIVI